MIEQVKDALHARGHVRDQIKMLMVLSDAAQKELEDREVPLSDFQQAVEPEEDQESETAVLAVSNHGIRTE